MSTAPAPDPFDPISVPMQCRECGVEFRVVVIPSLADDFDPHPDRPGWKHGTCSKCSDAASDGKAAQAKAEAAQAAERVWGDICPAEFKTVQEGGPTRLDVLEAGSYLQERSDGSVRLTYSGVLDLATKRAGPSPLLYMAGQSGTRKTRIAWRVVRAYFDAEVGTRHPRPVAFLSSWDFQASAQDSAGRYSSGAWLGSLVRAAVVVLDDLGKTSWTDNTSQAFFELLDQRTVNHRPTVITSNLAGAALRSWLQNSKSAVLSDATEPILRRIRDHGVFVTCT